jgi:hypothetical protein
MGGGAVEKDEAVGRGALGADKEEATSDFFSRCGVLWCVEGVQFAFLPPDALSLAFPEQDFCREYIS